MNNGYKFQQPSEAMDSRTI